MYYDPMISKLISWGKDRKTALDLLSKAMDEYVIRGVVHNLGFGQSIIRNKSFAEGHYTTAFIPTYYPDGFRGDPLETDDIHQLAIASHYIRNLGKTQHMLEGQATPKQDSVVYAVLKAVDKDHDYKIEQLACGGFEVTDIETGTVTKINATNFDFEYGSLLRFDVDGQRRLI